jgi:hypothetical protein
MVMLNLASSIDHDIHREIHDMMIHLDISVNLGTREMEVRSPTEDANAKCEMMMLEVGPPFRPGALLDVLPHFPRGNIRITIGIPLRPWSNDGDVTITNRDLDMGMGQSIGTSMMIGIVSRMIITLPHVDLEVG